MAKSIALRSVGGRRPAARRQIGSKPAQAAVDTSILPPGSYTFKPSASGFWKFIAWGAGGGTTAGGDTGASGSYGEITKYLNTSQVVAIVVAQGLSGGVTPAATTLTFPDGTVATATSGGQGVGAHGVATGFDVNLNGSDGVVNASGNSPPAGLGTGGGVSGGANGGAGAPANLPFHGGRGAQQPTSTSRFGGTPGGGAAQDAFMPGGDGLVLAEFVRA